MINGHNPIVNGASAPLQGLALATERMNGAWARAAQGPREMARELERLERRSASAGVSIKGLLSTVLGLASATQAARGVASFETSLQRIVGVLGVAQDEVDEMGAALRRMAPEVARGPGALAEALLTATSAGARGRQALNIVRESARATAVGLGSTATIADTVTRAIDAWGSANLDAGRAVGILVGAVREGEAAAGSLAPALGQLAPIAAELGVGFDRVGAATAFLTRGGMSAGLPEAGMRRRFRGRGAHFRGGPWSAVKRPVRHAFMGRRSNERRGTVMPERGTARRAQRGSLRASLPRTLDATRHRADDTRARRGDRLPLGQPKASKMRTMSAPITAPTAQMMPTTMMPSRTPRSAPITMSRVVAGFQSMWWA